VERRAGHAFFAVIALGVITLACKYSYTPPGSTRDAGDASADVVEELDTEAHGACDPNKYANFKCLAGGKAARCKTIYLREYARDTRTRGEWRTFSCPDCRMSTHSTRLECSSVAPGDECDTFVVQEACTADKQAMYTCDYATSTWKIERCSGGCKDDPPFKPTCKD
jgi:hypothetical protein